MKVEEFLKKDMKDFKFRKIKMKTEQKKV